MGERRVAPVDRKAVDGHARIEAEDKPSEAVWRRGQTVFEIEQQRIAGCDPHLAAHLLDIRSRLVLGRFVRRHPGIVALHLVDGLPRHGADKRGTARAERDAEQQLAGHRLVPARMHGRRADHERRGEQQHAKTLNQIGGAGGSPAPGPTACR